MTTSLLSRRLFSGGRRLSYPSLRLLSTSPDPDAFTSPDPDTFTSPDATPLSKVRSFEPRQLEGGTDPGLYKAILVGKVGQAPIQRRLRSGTEIVLFSLATGGIRNHRRPLPHERPEEYADRCAVQWHRVCVYTDRITPIAMRNVKPGYLLIIVLLKLLIRFRFFKSGDWFFVQWHQAVHRIVHMSIKRRFGKPCLVNFTGIMVGNSAFTCLAHGQDKFFSET